MRKSEIPFPCDNYNEARNLFNQMKEADLLTDTRDDDLAIAYERDEWYVIVRTGNIRGMVRDLEETGFLS